MKKNYSYRAPLGTFYICRKEDSYFSLLNDELLGAYRAPELD